MNPADHVGLVWMVAKKYQQRCAVPVEDLVQEGAIGLTKAAKKFDPTRGVEFSTYAVWWINANIKRYIEDFSRHIRLPNKIYQKHAKAKTLPPRPLSLDLEMEMAPGVSGTLHDFVADDSPNPEDGFAEREEREIVKREIGRLSKRSKHVLHRRFVDGVTLQEVGDELGLSRERVRQIEAEALKLLRPRLEAALS